MGGLYPGRTITGPSCDPAEPTTNSDAHWLQPPTGKRPWSAARSLQSCPTDKRPGARPRATMLRVQMWGCSSLQPYKRWWCCCSSAFPHLFASPWPPSPLFLAPLPRTPLWLLALEVSRAKLGSTDVVCSYWPDHRPHPRAPRVQGRDHRSQPPQRPPQPGLGVSLGCKCR